MNSAQKLMQRSDNFVAVSGGFDPVHVGHLRMFKEAAGYGKLIVILNSDEWLIRKKGYIFMPFDERKEIIESFDCVYDVIEVDDTDLTVCEALERLRPTFFANGGDRKSDNVPEVELCERLNISLIWNVGGDKIQSSTDLINSLDTGDNDVD
jgi:D-beta-D-heptose 7-phosphate kinase/D-beta-D-heptose 1-phosphate adenosyltransferase